MRSWQRRHVILVAAAFALLPVCAGAHGLGAECKLSGDRVALEAFYDDDTPARNARVWVEDAQKRVIAEGHTDPHGRWAFVRPEAGRYVVRVDAGAGHRTRLTLTIPPVGAAAAEERPADSVSEAPAPEIVSESPDRAEFTRFPWLRLSLGLAVIAGLATAAWRLRRGRAAPKVDRAA